MSSIILSLKTVTGTETLRQGFFQNINLCNIFFFLSEADCCTYDIRIFSSRQYFPAYDPFEQITVSFSQLSNASHPIFFTLLGIVTEARLMHPENVSSSISVTPSGIVIEARLAQPENAASPIFFTLSGIVIEVRLAQRDN